ncbi:MAG: hypothetical protein QOJ64_1127 [Acidobacteriota bacterium]|jgi:hypothetical protein|nr:hypothetical protein [Acidobacteriota bacterium]
MSSPAITIERTASPEDFGGSLRALFNRRRFFQVLARTGMVFTGAIFVTTLMAFVDYTRPLQRTTRLILLLLLAVVVFFLLAQTLWRFLHRPTLVEIARHVERLAGRNQNSLVTLAENLESVGCLSQPYMLRRLNSQASLELSKIDHRVMAQSISAMRWTIGTAAALLIIIALRVAAPTAFAREVHRLLLLSEDGAGASITQRAGNESSTSALPSIQRVTVRVIPPAYSGLSVEETTGDAPVRALAGSQIEVVLDVTGNVEGATLGFNAIVNPMRSLGDGLYSGTLSAGVSGAFEARVVADAAVTPPPVVRAVEVYNDGPPEVRLTQPTGDQLLRALPNSPINVRWEARDDLGLGSVVLEYIKSRGEGDSAKFTNGELGIREIAREGTRDWRGSANLDLGRLDMQPGDTLVFWIEARDRNPSANNLGRSASLAIAMAAPELAKLNLSDLMPSEIGRFLLSERQIINHTERLHSERGRLSPAELKNRANDIAAEQRAFKNTFSDYINIEGEGEEQASASGGEPTVEERVRAAEDERTAPHFHGIPEPPPGSPTSVRELTYAIRAMWDAEDALTNADSALALTHEREALLRLKKAQSALRYIPPIVAQSKPVDLKRRYAGELAEIKTRLEKLSRRADTKESGPVRAALADAYSALGDLQETLGVSVNARPSAIARAGEKARHAADLLVAVTGGDHAATIAEAAGQLRVVEVELGRTEPGGTSDEFANRIAKPLALLTQAASNLFAIVESRTRATSGESNNLLPNADARAAEYFRRLAGGGR